MHIDIVPNRGSKPAVLLRESWREGKKVRKRTLANLSSLPMEQVQAIRRILKGEALVPPEELFEVVQSVHHGHVLAVVTMMKRLGFPRLLASRSSRERDVAMAAIAARVLQPNSKLSMTRWWRDTTLPDLLGVAGADEDDVYAAMDWLLKRQPHIEKKLAARHLEAGALVCYDLTSSYFEGRSCPLAALGHNRDGKAGKLQVNYGIMIEGCGRPVSLSVFAGNTGDPTTLVPQVHKAREEFGIGELVMVGDRGMISQKQIDELKQLDGVRWITALRTEAIRKLVEGGTIQLGLFDERNLFEFTHSAYPGERLVACRNPELAKLRAAKRQDLLAATARELDKVCSMVKHGRLKKADEIGVRVGKVVNKYKVAKHFDLDIAETHFEYQVNEDRVAAEAALDGIYVIRTSVPEEQLDAEDVVLRYKDLSKVERAFRTMKGLDLLVRPIFHRLEDRVRAHLFLCMLAYYVQWHLVEAWRPLLFHDEDLEAKQNRDPVAPAQRSAKALEKARTKTLDDGTEVYSFSTLLAHMSTIVRNTCRRPGADATEPTFHVDTRPNPKQQRALDLIATLQV
jgi:transposase